MCADSQLMVLSWSGFKGLLLNAMKMFFFVRKYVRVLLPPCTTAIVMCRVTRTYWGIPIDAYMPSMYTKIP